MLVVLFYCGILFFYNSAKTRNSISFIPMGMCFALAVCTKLDGVFFVFSLAMLLVLDLLLKKISLKNILHFCLGSFIVLVPILVFFVIPNHENYVRLFELGVLYPGEKNIRDTLVLLATFPFRYENLFHYPSGIVILLFGNLWFLAQASKIIQNGLKATILQLNHLERFCLCWIIGMTIGLSLNASLMIDRRIVSFFIPYLILSAFFVFKHAEEILSFKLLKLSSMKKNAFIIVSFALVLVFGFYTDKTISYVLNKWIYAILSPGENAIDQASILIKLFAYCFSATIIFLLTSKRQTLVIKYFLVYFILVNVSVVSIWFAAQTFSVRNTSKQIEALVTDEAYLTGIGEHPNWMALEINKPIFPYYYNQTLAEVKVNREHVDDVIKSSQILIMLQDQDSTINPSMYNKSQYSRLSDFQLVPYPFSEVYRVKYKLYKITP